MAALSDTPTPPQAMSMPKITIKLEQGVLHDDGDYGSGSVVGTGRGNHHGIMRCDTIHPPDRQTTDDGFPNGVQIKSEPAIDIDDTYGNSNSNSNSICLSDETKTSTVVPTARFHPHTNSPIIRITPTTKLMPTPNAANPKRRYECPYENCTKSYGKSSHLRSHLTWHTGIKPFVCREKGCGKGFTRSDELNRHVRTHTGEKPFECVQCSKKFSRSDHLTKHLATHTKQMGGFSLQTPSNKRTRHTATPQTPNTSTGTVQAPSPVNNSKDFDEGMHFMSAFIPKVEPKEEIIESEKDADTPESPAADPENKFPGHNIQIKEEKPEVTELQSFHHHIQQPYMPAVKSEPLYCHQFQTEPQFDDDEDKNVKYEEDEPDDDAIMPEANLPPLPLTVIKAATTMLANSLSPQPQTAKVGVAGSGSHHLPNTKSPMRDTVRPYPCSQCPKKFKRLDDLSRHTRTHTGEKPFACNECEKRFMRSDHLKKHMNIHTRIR